MIQLDGIPYNVGGFLANTTRGYLNRTDLRLKMMSDTDSFQVIIYFVLFANFNFNYFTKLETMFCRMQNCQ